MKADSCVEKVLSENKCDRERCREIYLNLARYETERDCVCMCVNERFGQKKGEHQAHTYTQQRIFIFIQEKPNNPTFGIAKVVQLAK